MSLQNILFWVKMAGLILTYGWKLAMWFKERHDKIEKEAKKVVMTPDDKANMFNRGAANDIMHVQGRAAVRGELNQIRETVWKANNPNKEPKPLSDPRLKIKKIGTTWKTRG